MFGGKGERERESKDTDILGIWDLIDIEVVVVLLSCLKVLQLELTLTHWE